MTAKAPRRERWLTAQETAERLRVKRKTLYNWASTWEVEHRGPEPHRLGGRALRYRESEVDQYIDQQPHAPSGTTNSDTRR
ncbi:helix-turn-helix domain-containing protein [Streptomyces sp. NPDC091215]|uniref:helix-turn-helix transcriptional regulator n=1 Tax=Streptomyces sp. NPDC091215 TaxID=3155192 RepID=UPI0034496ED0